MNLDPHQLQEFARRYTAAWCGQNAGSVAAFYSPQGSLTINGGTPAIGRTAIATDVQGFMTAFPDLKVIMDNLVVHDDCAEYHWTVTGSNTGPGGTGRSVRISGFELWRMGEDGFISDSKGQFDNLAYQRQLKD